MSIGENTIVDPTTKGNLFYVIKSNKEYYDKNAQE